MKTAEVVIWLAVEPDGTEGIMAWLNPSNSQWMPLVATRGAQSEKLNDEVAKRIAQASGKRARKVCFRRAEVLEEIKGREMP